MLLMDLLRHICLRFGFILGESFRFRLVIHFIGWLSVLHKMLWRRMFWILTYESLIITGHSRVLYSFFLVKNVFAVNKQLNDKERVAAALENPNLLDMVDECLAPSYDWRSFLSSQYDESRDCCCFCTCPS